MPGLAEQLNATLPGKGRVIKRFRVAYEGQTVDGRVLSRQDIKDMGETYNLGHYGARINMEHIPGWSAEPPFNAYGDVLLVEATEENGIAMLYNTLSALPNLLAINEKGQKIYPSIEFYRDFAGSGKAYQVGLALTDNPNSLRTEPIKFSSNPTALRTQPDKELYMTFGSTFGSNNTDPAQPTGSQDSLLDSIRQLLSAKPKPKAADAEAMNILTEGVHTALQGVSSITQTLQTLSQSVNNIQNQLQQLTANPAAATPVAGMPADNPAPVGTGIPAAPVSHAVQTPGASSVTPPVGAPGQQQVTLETLAQQFAQMQQQFQTMSTTPVNGAPPAGTGTAATENAF
jgi:hypothetical protein